MKPLIIVCGLLAYATLLPQDALAQQYNQSQRPSTGMVCGHNGCQQVPPGCRWIGRQSGSNVVYVVVCPEGRDKLRGEQQITSKPANASRVRVASAHRKPQKSVSETTEKRSAFSGTESRIAAMTYGNTDCSPGPLADVRVVTPPANGDIRMEPVEHAVNRKPDNNRAHCNGKVVNAIGVFYKSKQDFVGVDKIVLDVDFHDGYIKRFTYQVEVR
jgi:hypothetical protein